jgi:hypothetical protein
MVLLLHSVCFRFVIALWDCAASLLVDFSAGYALEPICKAIKRGFGHEWLAEGI